MLFGPEPDAADSFAETFATRGQRIVDVRRNNGMDAAGDEAISLKLAKSFCKHLLADTGDPLSKVGEAKLGRGLGQLFDDEQGPFVGDALEHLVDEGLLCRLRCTWDNRRLFYTSHTVSIERKGAYFLKESVIATMTAWRIRQ